MIGALLGKALMAVGLFMCSVNSDVFHAWVIQILLPSLPPDSVVVMDNATFHKRLATQKVIDDAGHIIEYLPPYSPDLNPVEHKWAEAKSKKRAVNCSIDALFSHYMTSPKLFRSAMALLTKLIKDLKTSDTEERKGYYV